MGEINLPLENELMQQPCHKAVHDGASPDGDVKSFWCVWYSKPFFILCYLTSDFQFALIAVCVCLSVCLWYMMPILYFIVWVCMCVLILAPVYLCELCCPLLKCFELSIAPPIPTGYSSCPFSSYFH